MKITPQWISDHFDQQKALEKYRYKTKYRREDLDEEKWGIDMQTIIQDSLNHNADVTPRYQQSR